MAADADAPNTLARWGFTMWTMAGMSSKTTDACLADTEQYPGWGMLGRQPRCADLVPDISFPWWDKYGGSCWFSCLKKSAMSALGRAFRDKNSLVMTAAFALADPSCVETFFRSTRGLLLKVYKPALGMTSDKGFEAFSILSRTNYLNLSLTNSRSIPQTICNLRVHDLSSIQCNKIWSSLLKGANDGSLLH